MAVLWREASELVIAPAFSEFHPAWIHTQDRSILVYILKEVTHMGRTNIDIDEALVQRAMRLTGARTKREAVNIALRRLVDKGSLYRAARRLRGNLAWQGDVGAWRAGRSSRG